ncbi:thermonuclease family protein [Rhodobacteraceae bacterium CCMM004]|nr:thermonuclease family protein [Rhodobacteraceae bacterium CCMM004]
MGLPPHRPRRRRVGLATAGALVVVGALVAGTSAGDAVVGWVRAGSDCRLVRVIDGDTVDIACGRGIERARIVGYDTPEVFSPRCASEWARGMAATWHLRSVLWRSDRLVVVRQGRDRYDRVLAQLFVDGRRIAAHMIDRGVARPYAGGRRGGWCP